MIYAERGRPVKKQKTGVLRFLCQAIEAFSFYFRTRSLSFLSFLIDTMNLYMEIFGKVYDADSFLSPSFPYVIYATLCVF